MATKDGKTETPKRLYKSADNKLLCGVCGGIAEYLEVDATWLRLAIVLAALIPNMSGTIVILYLIGCIIIPENPAARKAAVAGLKIRQMPADKRLLVERMESREEKKKKSSCAASLVAIGVALMIVGAFYYLWYNGFITPLIGMIEWRLQWPFAVIAAGVLLLIAGLLKMIFRR